MIYQRGGGLAAGFIPTYTLYTSFLCYVRKVSVHRPRVKDWFMFVGLNNDHPWGDSFGKDVGKRLF